MRAAEPRLRRWLDLLSDWSIAAYAIWTLLAYVGMATGAPVDLLFGLWLATLPLLGVAFVVAGRRAGTPSEPGPPRAPEGEPTERDARWRPLMVVGLASGAASAAVAAVFAGAPWVVVWFLAVAAVAAAVAGARLRTRTVEPGAPLPGSPADLLVAAAGLGFAAMSLFVNNQNADDVFYVNRATATAELGRIPVRDVVFTNEEVARAGGTGLPLDSFSALQGAIGRFADVHAASVAYYVAPPLATFLATWALWRLLRSWAARRALLCFALGCVFWLWSAQFDLSPGNFFLTRMWHGKVVFVAWLVPTLYLYLTRWLGRRDGLTAVMLPLTGFAAIGMTGSATFVVPLVVVAALLPLLLRRDWRGTAIPIAAAGVPALVGFVASRMFPLPSVFTQSLFGTDWYYHAVFGVGIVSLVAALGVWSGPWFADAGPAAALTTGIAAVVALLLAPGVLDLLNEALGLSGSRTLRRAFWTVPFPAVVGLLAALPLAPLLVRASRARVASPRARRLVAVVPALVAAALLVFFGTPLWSAEAGSHWTSRPQWKSSAWALDAARGILRSYDGRGRVLAEQPVMKAISLLTAETKAVNPRDWYAKNTRESPERTEQRLLLTRLVMADGPPPPRAEASRALADLRVDLVCLQRWKVRLLAAVEAAGPYHRAFRAGDHLCLVRARDGDAAG